MIVVDFNQAMLAAINVHRGDEFHKGKDPSLIGGMIRHMLLNMLLSYKKKYGQKYGNIVLACDSRSYWRRDHYWWYKGHRKHDREESQFDWKVIFDTIEDVKKELRENFRYIILDVPGAEADDIIGVLCKYLQDHETEQVGLFNDEPQEVLIISSDGDFGQLQKYKNVSQFSPILKKMLKVPGRLEDFVMEHIVKGDTGDNIGNIFTSVQWSIDRANGVKPKKQTPVKAAKLEEFFKNGRAACSSDLERENFDRNEELVSFDRIPQRIYDKVVGEYTNYVVTGSRTKVYNYLLKHKMKVLINDAGSF